MPHRRSLIAANWKMNGSLESISSLVGALSQSVSEGIQSAVVICPPFVYLSELAGLLKESEIRLGAQNVSHLENGAYTGEVSSKMLKDFGCHYVIVGHSERRTFYGENDVRVAEKFVAVQANGMIPILCIGELLEERESSITEKVIARQLDAVIDKAGIAAFKQAVIAYEPVWAIGTGKTATSEQAQEVHEFIRLRLARHDNETADVIRILYGGSVKADNAKQLFEMADIDGGLVGGASLVAEDFLSICRAMR
ncbi:MAG: triose-phosphate isomerase [Proteobacteria bacterium]|nr:triose-phosphate isomerase [Pseudomonadota bacterium]